MDLDKQELIDFLGRHDNSDSAFPIKAGDFYVLGLTKREYFAAMAMQGMLANPNTEGADWRGVHFDAVKKADDLIQALNR